MEDEIINFYNKNQDMKLSKTYDCNKKDEMINFSYKNQDTELSNIEDDYDEKDDNYFDKKSLKICEYLIYYEVIEKTQKNCPKN